MRHKLFTVPVLILACSIVSLCGTLNFTLAPEILLLASQTAIASADLNEDGVPDLIIGGEPVGDEQGKIRVLLGSGNGTFGLPTAYIVGYNPTSFYNSPYIQAIKVTDLDGDGHLDVVVAHNGEPNIANRSTVFATVLFGDGTGRLQPADGYNFIVQQNAVLVSSIDFGDFNHDGRQDIVLGAKVGIGLGTAFFLENRGNRQFERKYFPLVGANVNEIAAADFDHDSFTDLIMSTTGGVLIVYGNGNYYDNNSRYEQRDEGIFEVGLTVKDFNQDGRPDFAVGEATSRRFRVYLNGVNGLATTPVIYATNVLSTLLKNADIDGDGKTDLLVSDSRHGDLQIFYGTGAGTFGNAETVALNLPVSDLTFDDFDGNGKTDIAFSLYRDPPGSQAGVLLNAPRRRAVPADFDGDGKSDLSVFRPGSNTWYLQQTTAGFAASAFGLSTDRLVPADYDGDGKTDVAVYRAGIWYLNRSTQGFTAVSFGTAEDIPVPADYDGDERADIAVFRPSNGTWYLLRSQLGFTNVKFGQSGDKPVAGDYDGDGKADLAVNRNGTWFIQRSQAGFFSTSFGFPTDRLVPADYDGDGKTDLAVFRPSNGTWYLLQSTAGFVGIQFGIETDRPTPADYDGDGKTDISVFRDGVWYLQRSSQGFAAIYFGTATDDPIPNTLVR